MSVSCLIVVLTIGQGVSSSVSRSRQLASGGSLTSHMGGAA
jgi:hypothetical protein